MTGKTIFDPVRNRNCISLQAESYFTLINSLLDIHEVNTPKSCIVTEMMLACKQRWKSVNFTTKFLCKPTFYSKSSTIITARLMRWLTLLLLDFKICKICVEIGSPYYLRKSQVMNKKILQSLEAGNKKIFWIQIQYL